MESMYVVLPWGGLAEDMQVLYVLYLGCSESRMECVARAIRCDGMRCVMTRCDGMGWDGMGCDEDAM